MPQFVPTKSWLVVATMLGVVAVLCGCGDDAEHKASKQARISSEKALEIYRAEGDIEAARKELQKALAAGEQAGSAKDTAIFIGAELMFTEAESGFSGPSGVVAKRRAAVVAADKVSKVLGKIRDLRFERERLSAAADTLAKEREELVEILTKGNGQGPLKSRLAEEQRKVKELETERGLLQRHVAETEEQAAELQQQAEALLRMAEPAVGEEKVKLQRQAYDLLLDSSAEQPMGSLPALIAQAQRGRDLIESIDKQLALIKPAVSRLGENTAAVEQRIKELESSPNVRQLKLRMGEIDVKLAKQRQGLLQLAGQLKKLESDYSEAVGKVVDLLVEAGKEYKKAGRAQQSGVSAAAKLAGADCTYRTAVVCADDMAFKGRFGRRLKNVAELSDEAGAKMVGEIAERWLRKADEYGFKAMDYFTDAVEEYEKLGRSHRGSKDGFGCSVIKNHILALIGKSRLAEKLSENETARECMSQGRELLEEAQQCDSEFSDSAAAAILRPGGGGAELSEGLGSSVPSGVGAGGIDITAMKEQAKAQLEAQRKEFMNLPEQERQSQLALMLRSLEEGEGGDMAPQQVDKLKGLLRRGDVEGFFDLMEKITLEAIDQMAPMLEQMGGGLQSGLENMADEMKTDVETMGRGAKPRVYDVNSPVR